MQGTRCILTPVNFEVRLLKTGVLLSRSDVAGPYAMSNRTVPLKTSCYFVITNERMYNELKCN